MTAQSSTIAIVLAAGQGKRMRSALPKVLHPIAGRPLVTWPVQAAFDAGLDECVVVVGPKQSDIGDALLAQFPKGVRTAVQPAPNGTGDAVRYGLGAIDETRGPDFDGWVVILYGDCPLVPPAMIGRLLESAHATEERQLALVTGTLTNPTGYGRVVRDGAGNAVGVVEDRDCSQEQRRIQEVNPGLYAARASFLRQALTQLAADNAQGELYLTDLVAIAAQSGTVGSITEDMNTLRGINDRYELAQCARHMRDRIVERLARSGVGFLDPDSVWIDAQVELEPDVTVGPNVSLRGSTHIAAGAFVDVGCVLQDVRVAKGVRLLPYTVAAQSVIGEGAQVGPFTHLRPGADLGPSSRAGNFVELKKTRLGRGSKANHLAYLGDGEVGENVNIGAGTIFCNYDGENKHVTTIEDNVFIGSDSQLVAPLRVGRGAYVASGTTVVKDVPADALAIARHPQKNKEGYARKLRAQRKKV